MISDITNCRSILNHNHAGRWPGTFIDESPTACLIIQPFVSFGMLRSHFSYPINLPENVSIKTMAVASFWLSFDASTCWNVYRVGLSSSELQTTGASVCLKITFWKYCKRPTFLSDSTSTGGAYASMFRHFLGLSYSVACPTASDCHHSQIELFVDSSWSV